MRRKKIKLILAFLVSTTILFTFSSALAQNEKINKFNVEITINSDSSIIVTEKIAYDFGTQNRHGIYRDIPYRYETEKGIYKLDFRVQNVVDETGSKYRYETSTKGDYISIKIGDPNVYVTGENIYIITYEVGGALNYFDEHDELYWNATGNEWAVNIYNASIKISLPQNIKSEDIKLTCYTGKIGSREKNCKSEILSETETYFESTKMLLPGGGLTIVLGWPKGIVKEVPKKYSKDIGTTLLKYLPYLIALYVLVIPLVTLGAISFIWNKYGRDPAGKGTIIPIYSPPDKLTPMEIGSIVDERADLRDISATIIDLAVKGYMKIHEIKEKGFFKTKRDYEFIKLKEADEKLESHERELFNALFTKKPGVLEKIFDFIRIFDDGRNLITEKRYAAQEEGRLATLKIFDKKGKPVKEETSKEKPLSGKTVVRLSELKGKFYENLPGIKSVTYETLVNKGYFPTNPDRVRNRYYILAGVLVVINIISAIIVGLFGRAMPRKTKRGKLTHEAILGFKEFLTVTEKDRLKFFNAPEKSPEMFEKFLPHAMALGVERQWAKQFEGIFERPSDWYEGDFDTINAIIFTNMISDLTNNMNTAFASTPGGAASGVSGFGGGGFSGGGFGGGGGGSW